MQPNITQVEWSATNVPSGLSFNAQTGTFSGTPTTSGTYTVPVHVETNYGEDTKDVTIAVETPGYDVYAVGAQAATWSEGAEADSYGFRKLNIPKANKLSSILGGFAAKATNGDWYVGSNLPVPIYHDAVAGAGDDNRDFSVPRQYLGDKEAGKIVAIVGGNKVGSGLKSSTGSYSNFESALAILDENGIAYIYEYEMDGQTHAINVANSYRNVAAVKRLQEDFASGIAVLKTDDTLASYIYGRISRPLDENATGDVVKIVTHAYDDALNSGFLYLTSTGELWGASPVSSFNPSASYRVAQELGAIKNFWYIYTFNVQNQYFRDIFVQTKDNKLYARGCNTKYELGLSEAKSYTEFTEVGLFDIKTMSYPFMLTNDGKLYHVGNYAITHSYYGVSGIDGHTEFTQIFPDYKFHDIALASRANTLVVTRE